MFAIPENHISKNPYVIENTKFCEEEEPIMLTSNELQSVYNLDKKLQSYEKCLIEMREIAEKIINSSDCYERMYGGMCARPILKKISEVLDD